MRTYLKVPFAEKDEAKALGARWEPARKSWYVEGKDLAPFGRWPPAGQGGTAAPARSASGGTRTGPAQLAPHCGCDVLPWEPCVHTPAAS